MDNRQVSKVMASLARRRWKKLRGSKTPAEISAMMSKVRKAGRNGKRSKKKPAAA